MPVSGWQVTIRRRRISHGIQSKVDIPDGLGAIIGVPLETPVMTGLATGASWLCYFRALQLGEVSRVAPVDKLSIVVAMALAMLFLNEQPTWRHWLGGGLIVSGTMVLTRT